MNSYLKTILYTTVLLITLTASANSEEDEIDPPPGDPGTATPINDYIPLLIIGASALGFYFLPRKELKSNQ